MIIAPRATSSPWIQVRWFAVSSAIQKGWSPLAVPGIDLWLSRSLIRCAMSAALAAVIPPFASRVAAKERAMRSCSSTSCAA